MMRTLFICFADKSLKYLKIGFGNISIGNIWCHQIPLDFFSGLETLAITDCGSVRSLFSSSIAGDLVNLKHLEINNCQEMEKVIADEEMLCEKPLFHRLKSVKLLNLPKLRSFYKWSFDLELPCLEKVEIDECPLTENFTTGSLSTPELKWTKIGKDSFSGMRELNDFIKQLHFKANEHLQISNAQESTSSYAAEGKDGEEQEDKCEIKFEEIC